MKELSIEQKAQRYNEALKRAMRLYEQGTITESLSYIFPELKESEDERTRKEIIRYLKVTSPAMGENIEKMLDWLEKQGETYTKKDIDNAYLEGMAFAKDELEKQNKQILANSAKTCKDEQQPTDNEMKELLHTEYEKGRADAIAEMQVAWSEEDEEMFEKILQQFMTANNDCKLHNASFTYDKEISFLKFLKGRVQPKQEWSEEDIRNIEDIDSILFYNKYLPEDTCMRLRNWLKSLRPQNRWKPSDEQIKALHDLNLTGNISYAGQGQVLIELYNDLKKLAEE